jgi:hypothetical protein
MSFILCNISKGEHYWSIDGYNTNLVPDDDSKCNCGLFTWKEIQEQKEIEIPPERLEILEHI